MTVPEWVLAAWKERVRDKSEAVDPLNEFDWTSIAMGFCLGHGFKPAEAYRIAKHIRNLGL